MSKCDHIGMSAGLIFTVAFTNHGKLMARVSGCVSSTMLVSPVDMPEHMISTRFSTSPDHLKRIEFYQVCYGFQPYDV